MLQYRENRTINRTQFPARVRNGSPAPVFMPPDFPCGLVDLQACPPRGWCVSCGGELYRPGLEKCPKCAKPKYSIDN